jgi:predicted ferric reductase
MNKRPLTLMLVVTALLYCSLSYLENGWPADYWAWRKQLVTLAGVQLITVMSVSMLLAVRPRWLEQALGGLDKLYALHKRLGIAAGVLLGTHWLIELSPKLVVAMEWVAPRVKRARGVRDPLVSLAKDMGEWAAWVVLGLIILALLRAVPYGFWRKLHKLFGPLYLMGAFHGAMLFPQTLWLTPLGMLLGGLLAVGSACALWSLFGRIGKARRVGGTVSLIKPLPGRQLEVICRVGKDWPGHVAGQFALVSFDGREGAHPFTIASANRRHGEDSEMPTELRFIIKALGDYTAGLATSLKVGDAIEVEGPYGCFDFNRGGPRQAWVAGGIGVTPFLAWLEARQLRAAGAESAAEVDLYYCVRNAGQAAGLAELSQACARSKVRLHVIESDSGAQLDATQLPEVDDVWFCGPQGLGEALQNGLAARGGVMPAFHHEAFSMR